MRRVVAAPLLIGGLFFAGCSHTAVLPQNNTSTTARQMVSDGHVTHVFPINHTSSFIALGSDHNLWVTFSDIGSVARLTPAGTYTMFTVPNSTQHSEEIVPGAKGTLWFASGNNIIARIATATGHVTEFTTPGAGPVYIAYGKDGNIWFEDRGSNSVARMTPAGVIKEFPLPVSNDTMLQITPGPDGNLWYVAINPAGPFVVGRVTLTGKVTEFKTPHSDELLAIAAGPDGNLYAVGPAASIILRVSTSGKFTEFPVPSASEWIALGPDKKMWLTAPHVPFEFEPVTHKSGLPINIPHGCNANGNAPLGLTIGPDGDMWFAGNTENCVWAYEDNI